MNRFAVNDVYVCVILISGYQACQVSVVLNHDIHQRSRCGA